MTLPSGASCCWSCDGSSCCAARLAVADPAAMASSSKILGLLRTTLITLFPSIVSAPPHARLVFSQTFLADEQTRQDGGCACHSSALRGESMKTQSFRPDRGARRFTAPGPKREGRDCRRCRTTTGPRRGAEGRHGRKGA